MNTYLHVCVNVYVGRHRLVPATGDTCIIWHMHVCVNIYIYVGRHRLVAVTGDTCIISINE